MEKTHFIFGFRYDKRLGKRLRDYCEMETISLNTLVEEMLLYLADLHDEGRMCLLGASRFKIRLNKKDKVTTQLVLRKDIREAVHNLAFSYRISMAEVIRLGLEMYMDLQEKGIGKLDEVIHIYSPPAELPHVAIVYLYPVLPDDRIPYPHLE